jgi:hypothetical protein
VRREQHECQDSDGRFFSGSFEMVVEEDFEGNSIQDDWLARSSQNLACSMIFQRVAIELTQRRIGGHCWHHLRSWRANLVTPIVPHQTWMTNTMALICVWMFGRFQNRAGLLNLMVGASNSFLKPTKSAIQQPISCSASFSRLQKGWQG